LLRICCKEKRFWKTGMVQKSRIFVNSRRDESSPA
jgi:hypothetical protein